MEKGAKALTIMLLAAIAIGVLVMLINPEYRLTAVALWKGTPETSPLWISNINYYPEIAAKPEKVSHVKE